jgi:type I restriction enzyme M protein
VFDKLATLGVALQPYEEIKRQLTEARARYQRLVATFIDQLKARCAAKTDDEKQALVLNLMAEDAQVGLDSAVADRRRELVRFLENVWDKYRITLTDMEAQRSEVKSTFAKLLEALRYAK